MFASLGKVLSKGLHFGQNVLKRAAIGASHVHNIIHSTSPLLQHLSSHLGSAIGGTKGARGAEKVNRVIRSIDHGSDRINSGLQRANMASSFLSTTP